MANSIASLVPEFWMAETQKSLFVENKALAIANTRLENVLTGEGNKVHRTIISYPASSTYTPGSDITSDAVTASKETLTVNTWNASRVIIDDTEKVQSITELGQLCAKRMMKDHNNRIEQAVLAEVSNASWSLDDASVGGTAGNSIVVNTNTIPQVFIAADTKLDAIDAPKGGRVAVIGGHFLGQLKLQQAARATVFGDGVNSRGVVTNLFGWDILYSNNLPYSATLGIATKPTNGDTVVVAGVTFTFVTSIGTTAGNVLIGATAATAVTNLVALINAPATTTAQGVKLGSDDTFLLRDKRRLTATDNTTSLALAGYGDIVVSETLTASADVFSAQLQKSLFLVKGAIDLVVQIPPKVEVGRIEKQFADNVKSLLGYGKKTYADGAREMVYVPVDAGQSDWS